MSVRRPAARRQTAVLLGDRRSVRPDGLEADRVGAVGLAQQTAHDLREDHAKTGIGEDRLGLTCHEPEVRRQVAGERERLATDGRSNRGGEQGITPGEAQVDRRPSDPRRLATAFIVTPSGP